MRSLGFLTTLALLLAKGPADALPVTETRCGWLENPTPANFWLTDADGSWTLSTQGGYQAEGFFDLPASDLDFQDQWVSPSGRSYGYGCACVDGVFNAQTAQTIKVMSVEPLDLAQCHADPHLPPEPGN